MSDFVLPPIGFGPGSQPMSEDDQLEYMQLPQDMRTFTPSTPEVDDATRVAPAMAMLAEIAAACARVGQGMAAESFDLTTLDKDNRAFMAETMGEGEVAMKVQGTPALSIQESWFAGVWMVTGHGVDRIDVGHVPPIALERAHRPHRAGVGAGIALIPGLANGPALITELFEKTATWRPGDTPHVVNLTLLPHTEADLAWLSDAFGEGATTILSRGYGNCRITAQATPHLWRVQFFNSTEQLILDTFEVTDVPEVALAADVDLEDSAERITEVIEAIQ
ncbi:MAG TPA: hydrogenase expression/formation protein [Maritimibacter sp.]|nr:hydrogenase expression/formation protein [Maritimibacter sp.]